MLGQFVCCIRAVSVQYPCSIRAVSVQYPCSIQKHVITYFCAVSYCAFEGRQSCKKLLHMLEQKLQKAAKSAQIKKILKWHTSPNLNPLRPVAVVVQRVFVRILLKHQRAGNTGLLKWLDVGVSDYWSELLNYWSKLLNYWRKLWIFIYVQRMVVLGVNQYWCIVGGISDLLLVLLA